MRQIQKSTKSRSTVASSNATAIVAVARTGEGDIYFLLLDGKKKKDNKEEEPPAPAPKLKIAMLFLNGKSALRSRSV